MPWHPYYTKLAAQAWGEELMKHWVSLTNRTSTMTAEVMNERRAYVSNAGDYGPFEFATSWKYLGALMQVKIKYMITDLQEPDIQILKTTMRQGEHGQEVGAGGLDRLILSDPDVLAGFTAHAENEAKKIAR